MPFAWNSLEHYDSQTRLIHYTDMDTQPWVSPLNRNGPLWLDEVRLMIRTGALGLSEVRQEIELGYFRPSLMDEIDAAPHASGWNEDAAAVYAEKDHAAGFVRHAEVYRRKRSRAEAVKQFERRIRKARA